MAYQQEEDSKANSDIIDYEAIVEKANDVGLGIIVVEDKTRNQTILQSTLKDIKLRGLSEEAQGEMLQGDALVAIDKDDCSHWPIQRYLQLCHVYIYFYLSFSSFIDDHYVCSKDSR